MPRARGGCGVYLLVVSHPAGPNTSLWPFALAAGEIGELYVKCTATCGTPVCLAQDPHCARVLLTASFDLRCPSATVIG